MSEQDSRLDAALHEGLAALPIPMVSAGFDDRVLSAVARPTPWWIALSPSLRPALSAAACSLALTLLMIHWAIQTPVPMSPRVAAAPVTVSLDQILEQPNLAAGTFMRLSLVRPPVVPPEPVQPPATARRSEAHEWVRG